MTINNYSTNHLHQLAVECVNSNEVQLIEPSASLRRVLFFLFQFSCRIDDAQFIKKKKTKIFAKFVAIAIPQTIINFVISYSFFVSCEKLKIKKNYS